MFFRYEIDHPLDAPQRTMEHRQIIMRKKFLRKLYEQWYQYLLSEISGLPGGELVELGSGGGFLKDVAPRVIASDVLDLPTNDLTFSALDMPFNTGTVAALFMIDTLHHIPDLKQFFDEANRVLMPGGKIVMIEPANTLWGRFIFTQFHHEPFDPRGDWSLPQSGPLSGANGALPWIVLQRDKEKFKRLYPSLKICTIDPSTPLLYLLSGGLTYRQLLPDLMFPFFAFIDRMLPRLSKEISMFQRIVIEKT